MVRAPAPYAFARALAATAVVVTGAVAAHTWAGGTVPPAAGVLLVAAVVLAGGLLLFTREVPAWALLPVVTAAQLGLHGSFGLAAEHAHHAHHAATAPDPGWTSQMVAAHLFVTLLTAVLWWAGRRAASYAVWFRTRPVVPVATMPRRRPAEVRTGARLRHVLSSPRRGPPLAVLPT